MYSTISINSEYPTQIILDLREAREEACTQLYEQLSYHYYDIYAQHPFVIYTEEHEKDLFFIYTHEENTQELELLMHESFSDLESDFFYEDDYEDDDY